MTGSERQTPNQNDSGSRTPHKTDSGHWHDSEISQSSSDLSIFSLQRTIGNRALQRMLAGETSTRAIQRDHNENAQPADNQKGRHVALLTVFIDGKKLKGTSTVSGHEEALEIESYQFSGNSRGNSPGRGREEKEQPAYQELSLTKFMDSTSSQIAQAVANGTPITFKLVGGKLQDDGTFSPYLTIESNDALFSGYQTSSGGDRPMDSFSISYQPAKDK